MHVERGGRGRCAGWLAMGLVAMAPGCTPWEPPAPAAQPAQPASDAECSAVREEPLPVITTLITRDHEVTVYASDEGLRFSVALADGALLGRQLDAYQFEQSFPALHRRFDATFAGDELGLDASLQVPALGGLPVPSHGPGSP